MKSETSSAEASDFPPQIVRLRDAVCLRLRLEPHAGRAHEMAWALLVACRMQHPGVAVVWIRKQTANLVYHRRHVVAELKRNGHADIARAISERTVNDDDLIVVAVANEEDTPRHCVLDIGNVRSKQAELLHTAWPQRTL